MAHLEARTHISPDSGFPVTLHPHFNPKIKDHVSPEPIRQEITVEKDRAFFADPEKRSLFSVVTPRDLTESIGTVLEGVQLSQLVGEQLDELVALVNERGVVLFRGQDLQTDQQVRLFEHYSLLDRHPAQKDQRHVIIKGSVEDHREIAAYTPWPSGDFHADTRLEINAPSYSMLRMEKHPPVGGDTAWVSQYGLYDALNKAYQRFLDGLHAVHSSRLQYDTILDLWGTGPNRPPIDTHHPAVRTHPVTGWKALNVNPGFTNSLSSWNTTYTPQTITTFAGSGKWEVSDVAMWCNRCTAHRVIPGTYEAGSRKGIRTTVFGEKPYFDPNSVSRNEGLAARQSEKSNGKNTHVNGVEVPA